MPNTTTRMPASTASRRLLERLYGLLSAIVMPSFLQPGAAPLLSLVPPFPAADVV